MDADRSQPECAGCRRLEARVAELEALVKRLQELLEAKEREGKRQAAPFRKDKPAELPKKPGRKSGDEHGPHAHRAIPQKIDERYSAPLPGCCPHCQSHSVVKTTSDTQYQVEIVRTSVTRQFDIERGFCDDCGRAVQGRHPLQTSDALGAPKVTLGPEAQAAMTLLNKQAGLPYGKIKVFFDTFFGIEIARSTICRSVLRTGRKCQRAYRFPSSRIDPLTGHPMSPLSTELATQDAPRKGRFARSLKILAIALPLVYVASFGPMCRLACYGWFRSAGWQRSTFHCVMPARTRP